MNKNLGLGICITTYEAVGFDQWMAFVQQFHEACVPFLKPTPPLTQKIHWSSDGIKWHSTLLEKFSWNKLRAKGVSFQHFILSGSIHDPEEEFPQDVLSIGGSSELNANLEIVTQLRCDVHLLVLGDKVERRLQEALVALACSLFKDLRGTTGYILLGMMGSPFTSPYETILQRVYPQINSHFRTKLRGYYWGNLLSHGHLEQLGGENRLNLAPVDIVQKLAEGQYYLQLTQDINDCPLERSSNLRSYLLPVLLPHFPGFPLADDGSDIFALELAHSALDEERTSHSEIPEDNVDWRKATTALAELDAAMDAVAKSGNIQNVEALSWIRRQFPGNDSPLAGNRFDRAEAINFIEKLYTMGAVNVTVAIPQVENEEIFAFIHIDTLQVKLPDDPKVRKKLLSVLQKEMQDHGLWSDHDQAVIDDRNIKTVTLWWD